MKIVIIGANGQLGTELMKVFSQYTPLGLVHSDVDITEYEKLDRVLQDYNPEIVINTAAYHNVPECEKNPNKAFLTNAIGVNNLVKVCKKLNCGLIHISTDYVFDGKKNAPYNENDIPNPLNTYGISKLAGEFFVKQLKKYYIIRTASLFGKIGSRAKGGVNFVNKILELSKEKKEIEVTSNIICSPTYALDCATIIKELIEQNREPGIYHIVNNGVCSWYEFALEIIAHAKCNIKIIPVIETEESAGVKRPLYSALTSTKLPPLRTWQEALSAYLKEN